MRLSLRALFVRLRNLTYEDEACPSLLFAAFDREDISYRTLMTHT
jgi:hypothetical protein